MAITVPSNFSSGAFGRLTAGAPATGMIHGCLRRELRFQVISSKYVSTPDFETVSYRNSLYIFKHWIGFTTGFVLLLQASASAVKQKCSW